MNRSRPHEEPISPLRAATCLTETWSPRVIAELDDYYVKVARLEGEFDWHAHLHEDELFYVLQGCLHLQLPDRTLSLHAGDLYVVPRGVRHRPSAESACLVMLIEQRATVHAGDADTDRGRALSDQLRPIEFLDAPRAQSPETTTGRHPGYPDEATPEVRPPQGPRPVLPADRT